GRTASIISDTDDFVTATAYAQFNALPRRAVAAPAGVPVGIGATEQPSELSVASVHLEAYGDRHSSSESPQDYDGETLPPEQALPERAPDLTPAEPQGQGNTSPEAPVAGAGSLEFASPAPLASGWV